MGILSFLLGKSNKQSAIKIQIRMRAEEFVVTYGERYKGLDYSQQSLVVIDRLLSEYTNDWKDMSIESQSELLTNASSYILWIAHQQYNGNFYWSEQYLQPVLVIGEPDYRIAFMLQDKIHNYIEKKDDQKISLLYRKIAEEQQRAIKDSNILIR